MFIRHFTRRSCSTLVHVERHKSNSQLATVCLNRAPVNSLNLETIESLTESIQNLEKDPDVRGMILTSRVSNIFSAGLDITEMHDPDVVRLRSFWTALQNLWMTLYGTPLATVASIEGHAPAGGCLLAMSCDYRVMSTEKAFKMGLNEVALGIVAPFWFAETMSGTIGQRRAELALNLGTMFSPNEALEIGMVDEVKEDASKTRERSLEMLEALSRVPPHARHESKLRMRGALIDRLRRDQKGDADDFIRFVTQDFVQKGLGAYMASLKKKK